MSTTLNKPADEALYHRTKRGDMRAFDQLYARYEGPLFGYILRMVDQRADAEELFHEAFLRVLDAPEVSFETGSFRSWLYRIARNLSLNWLRAQQRRKARDHALVQEPQPVRPSADDALASQQHLHALRAAAASLPERLSEVMRLRTTGMAYEEIAHVLEIPLGTVKSRLHETIQRLRQELPT